MSASLSRRRMLTASLGAAAASLGGCTSAGTAGSDAARALDVPASARDVRAFGAVGDGVADDTAAIARAVADADGPLALYLPAGTYRVTGWPELPDYSAVVGEGSDLSTVVHQGDGPLWDLRDRHRVAFARLGVYVTAEGGSAARLSGCFRCSFDTVLFRGEHGAGSHPRFVGQRGVELRDNTGGTTFVNCDVNNFGVGLVASSIQNYVTASKFTSNWIGVLGTGPDYAPGLSVVNSEFVSDTDPATTTRHVLVDGPANDWWFTNVWFEGADVAVQAGVAGRGGPSQLGLVNCKVAARTVLLDLQSCRQPHLSNVILDPDPGATPVPLRIDPVHCPDGTAVNLVSGTAADVDLAAFPPRWHVVGRGVVSGAEHAGPLVVRPGRDAAADLVQARAGDGTVVSAVLPSGAFLSERAEAGVVLRDDDGGYWRLQVGPDGALRTARLGTGRPAG
ncbi:glycosyl hydrolase family 28-related protein [Pseudonocardia spirodelae]|uniref:Glycosyl hydrolase family 28-related protein n=1 Tax=Pseudonocardia spirodelae TaxID=3133431 RepID=A0ABU8T2U0_9PSEU